MDSRVKLYLLALVPAAIALNLAIGVTVNTLKLPVYLDAVGTILATLLFARIGLAGLYAGIFVGVSSFVVGGVLFNPVLFWFIGTQAVIAIYTYFVIFRLLKIQSQSNRNSVQIFLKLILAGIGLGITAAIVNSPVVVAVFGGVTGSGPSLIAAFFIKAGHTLYESVIYFGLTSEPIDKTLQLFLAYFIYKGMPEKHKQIQANVR